MSDLTAEEMVDWANANMERVEGLEAEIVRLTEYGKYMDRENEKAAGEIERLQALHLHRTKTTHKALTERDERIAKLEAENTALREALEKFATMPCSDSDTLQGLLAAVHILARAALATPTDEKE